MTTSTLGLLSRLWLAWVCFFRILADGAFAYRVRELSRGRALPGSGEGPSSSAPRAPREARLAERSARFPSSEAPTRRVEEADAADTERDPGLESGDESPDPAPAKAAPKPSKKPEQSTTLRSTPAPRAGVSVSPPPPSGGDAELGRQNRRDGALLLLELLQREGRLIDFLKQDVESFSDSDVGAAARVVHGGCRKGLFAHLELAPIRTEDEGASVDVEPGYDAQAIKLVGEVGGSPPYCGVLRHRGWRAKALRLPEPTEGHDASVLALAEVEL